MLRPTRTAIPKEARSTPPPTNRMNCSWNVCAATSAAEAAIDLAGGRLADLFDEGDCDDHVVVHLLARADERLLGLAPGVESGAIVAKPGDERLLDLLVLIEGGGIALEPADRHLHFAEPVLVAPGDEGPFELADGRGALREAPDRRAVVVPCRLNGEAFEIFAGLARSAQESELQVDADLGRLLGKLPDFLLGPPGKIAEPGEGLADALSLGLVRKGGGSPPRWPSRARAKASAETVCWVRRKSAKSWRAAK